MQNTNTSRLVIDETRSTNNFYILRLLSCLVGVSNGPIQLKSARKIWPLLELLACSCSQNFGTARMLGFWVYVLQSAVSVKDVWSQAEFNESYTVKQTAPTLYRGRCKHFLSTDGLCQHVGICGRENETFGGISDALQRKGKQGIKSHVQEVPTNASEKPSSKRRKAQNNVEARLIIKEEDPHDLSHLKAPRYTEYYHNDEPFHVVFAKNHPQAVQCISCDIGFPRRMPMVRPCLCTQGTLGVLCKRRQGKIVEIKITKTKLTNRF